jgi:hypothetical protein
MWNLATWLLGLPSTLLAAVNGSRRADHRGGDNAIKTDATQDLPHCYLAAGTVREDRAKSTRWSSPQSVDLR